MGRVPPTGGREGCVHPRRVRRDTVSSHAGCENSGPARGTHIMARDDFDPYRDPDRKRNGGSDARSRDGNPSKGPRDKASAAAWGPRRGRSGYGLESIRPHLRAQLEQQRLLRPTFPPDDDESDWRKK